MANARQIKKKAKEAKKRYERSLSEKNKVQRAMVAEDKKIDEIAKTVDRELEKWDQHPEVGSLVEILTSTNIQKYIRDSTAIQEVISGYFEKTKPFGPDGKLPVEKKVRALRELPVAIEEAFRSYGADIWTSVRNTIAQMQGIDEEIGEEAVMRAAAIVIAREAIKDETSKQMLALHPKATAEMAREGIDLFLHSHEKDLTGRALEGLGVVRRLSPKIRKGILGELEDPRSGYSKLANEVHRRMRELYEIVEPNQRSEAFEKTFEITCDVMKLSNFKNRGDGDALLAVQYLTAEKIFQESYTDAAKKLGAPEIPKVDPANVGLWSDAELTRTGVALWEKTYKLGLDDGETIRAARQVAIDWAEHARGKGILVNEHRVGVVESVCGFSAKWAVHAFQRITTTHTYAAALMCSDADKEVLEDIEMQWHAFMVVLPNGLLTYFDEERGVDNEYNRILVASFKDNASIILLNQNGNKSSHRLVVQISDSIAKVLDVKDVDLVHALGTESIQERTKVKVQRIMILAKRLVAGLLLALQHQDNFKSKTHPARNPKNPREPGEPAHRVVFVGKPLKVDCRPSIGDYIRNGSPKRKGAPPAVQFIVRGHYKRQVVGVGRMGRKVIWIEPFWKGSIDAPILTRPKKVEA